MPRPIDYSRRIVVRISPNGSRSAPKTHDFPHHCSISTLMFHRIDTPCWSHRLLIANDIRHRRIFRGRSDASHCHHARVHLSEHRASASALLHHRSGSHLELRCRVLATRTSGTPNPLSLSFFQASNGTECTSHIFAGPITQSSPPSALPVAAVRRYITRTATTNAARSNATTDCRTSRRSGLPPSSAFSCAPMSAFCATYSPSFEAGVRGCWPYQPR